jgi:hypothetical protein
LPESYQLALVVQLLAPQVELQAVCWALLHYWTAQQVPLSAAAAAVLDLMSLTVL